MNTQTNSANDSPETPRLSVIVPAYNEEENVIPLAEEIIAALSNLPGGFELILVDDVLYTGRTTRAAINELFDYGRPGNVRLAVLADRGGRQLPIYAEFCAWQVELADSQELVLEPDANGRLQWRCVDHA